MHHRVPSLGRVLALVQNDVLALAARHARPVATVRIVLGLEPPPDRRRLLPAHERTIKHLARRIEIHLQVQWREASVPRRCCRTRQPGGSSGKRSGSSSTPTRSRTVFTYSARFIRLNTTSVDRFASSARTSSFATQSPKRPADSASGCGSSSGGISWLRTASKTSAQRSPCAIRGIRSAIGRPPGISPSASSRRGNRGSARSRTAAPPRGTRPHPPRSHRPPPHTQPPQTKTRT